MFDTVTLFGGYPTLKQDHQAEQDSGEALCRLLGHRAYIVQSHQDDLCPPTKYPVWMETLRRGGASMKIFDTISHGLLRTAFLHGHTEGVQESERGAALECLQHLRSIWRAR